MVMEPFEAIAKILRTDKDYAKIAAQALTNASGHDDVLAKLVKTNERVMAERLGRMKVSSRNADAIFRALAKEVKEHDRRLWEQMHRPTCATNSGCRTLTGFAQEIANVGKGFFLRNDSAA